MMWPGDINLGTISNNTDCMGGQGVYIGGPGKGWTWVDNSYNDKLTKSRKKVKGR